MDAGDEVFLERAGGAAPATVARARVVLPKSRDLNLRISATGPNYSFFYDAGQGWQALRENDDGSILSTEVAGGFVGTVLGPFARQE
jgi:alpha-N-arabinofuranosidase